MATGMQQSRLRWVLALTTVFMVVEAVGGWIAGSLALLADAGHMLTDVGALALSLITAWIAQRPPDDSKTYGYLRWEILAALVNGAALFGIALWVVVEAVQRIQDPQPVRTGLFLVIAPTGRGASTSGAPTSTCWATRWARWGP
jgi:cobalt-zinc-cadmium efflux system protein